MSGPVGALAYQAKAEENLASAASEFANGRFNACASHAHFACFQAAIVALVRTGIQPTSTTGVW